MTRHRTRKRDGTARLCHCGTPLPEHHVGQLCDACVTDTTEQLEAIPALIADVILTVTRQTATGNRNGPRGTETVLAFNDTASTTLTTALVTLRTWAIRLQPMIDAFHRYTMRSVTALGAGNQPLTDQEKREVVRLANNLAQIQTDRAVLNSAPGSGLALFLARHITQVAQFPDAKAFVTAVDGITGSLLKVTDTPPPRLYLGICGADPLRRKVKCRDEVYVVDHTDPVAYGQDHSCSDCATAVCPTCGTEHNVAARRRWLREQLNDRLATAGDIARGLAGAAGVQVTEDQIRWWKRCGKVAPHGTDRRDRDVYRVGDILDLAATDTPTRGSKSSA